MVVRFTTRLTDITITGMASVEPTSGISNCKFNIIYILSTDCLCHSHLDLLFDGYQYISC